ncbi:TspO/MBR family protein [Thiohalorhabdus methylotrophus]|uniref:TspO/MBR family protein n=1 Tax=Thiohalorhabdus methylotrophus TaxID=3242694 RepID=A0ABV4TRS9_9GAMM
MAGREASATPSRGRDLAALAGFFALSLLVLAAGGQATATSVATWYPTLHKPAFNPPAWVFPPVWTALFVLIAIAGWRVWRRFRAARRSLALALFVVQLVLNLLWSVLFFGLRSPGAALVEILFLLAAIVASLAVFARVDRWAAVCFVPYAVWVAYAGVLNGMIWALN